MNRRELLAAGVASVSAVLLAPPAARGYPDRAVKLVVPFSPAAPPTWSAGCGRR